MGLYRILVVEWINISHINEFLNLKNNSKLLKVKIINKTTTSPCRRIAVFMIYSSYTMSKKEMPKQHKYIPIEENIIKGLLSLSWKYMIYNPYYKDRSLFSSLIHIQNEQIENLM